MSAYFVSTPLMPLASPPSPDATNTLAITQLPKSFFGPMILEVLRNHFSLYGEINQWVPLPGFGRILVVYEQEHQAEKAKIYCDPIILRETDDRSQVVLRVYRADPSPLKIADGTIPNHQYLQPPAVEKNFLISPPGSPPVGWEPIKEDPPNTTPLADDLIEALRRLQTSERRSGVETLLEPEDGVGVGVYVEDCDADADQDTTEEDWVYGQTMLSQTKWKPVATAMPPIGASV